MNTSLAADSWSESQHASAVAMTCFLSDRTAEAALKKGFLLSSFRTRSDDGTEYEYVIQNVNELLVPHKIEDILKRKALQEAVIAAQNRGSGIRPDEKNNGKGGDFTTKVAVYGDEII